MKIGDIVTLKKDSRLMGEVLAIDDMDMVKLKLSVVTRWSLL